MAELNPHNSFERDYAKLLKACVEQGKVPKYLYKYRSMESFKLCINNSSMYFPTFSQLNDPFEAFANYDTNNTDADWKKMFDKMGVEKTEQDNLLETIHKDNNTASKIINDCINNSKEQSGVLCMSGTDNNVLMWTHYGDEGKGVCMGFDITEDPCFFLIPKRINYDDQVITINYLVQQDQIMEPLYHKSSQWSYEDEYRIIKVGFKGLRKFSKSSLKNVIFGHNVQDKQIEECKVLLTQLGYSNITYKKAVVGNDPTKFNIVNI